MTEVSGTDLEAGGSAVPPFHPEVSGTGSKAGGPEKSPVREPINPEASPVRDMEGSESSPSEDEFKFGERPVWMAYHSAWLDEDEINPEEALSKKWKSLDSHIRSKKWDQWVHAGQTSTSATPQPAANHAVDASKDELEEGQSSEQKSLLDDDGVRRWRNRRTLRSCPEAFTLSGLELEESAAAEGVGSKGKRKRKRKRSKEKSDVRCGRGPGKPRDPTRLKDRPELIVIGDGEFTTSPLCTKVITTIRTLTLENLSGPYSSYHTFPSRVRLAILKQFLQRYSWEKDQDIGRCLDVFEKIAAANYVSHLSETRAAYKLKYSKDKAAWKDFPPPWCKNVEHWKGLCHMVKTPEGKKYVNQKAEDAAKLYDDLKKQYGGKKSDEELWSLAVKGEDKKGRIFGFGNKCITSKATRVLETLEADMSNPTKSTATSTSDADRKYSKDEVQDLLAAERARYDAERSRYAADMLAQEERHKNDLDELKKKFDYNTDCVAMLFKKVGCPPPPPPPTKEKGSSTEGNGGEGHSGGRVDDTQP